MCLFLQHYCCASLCSVWSRSQSVLLESIFQQSHEIGMKIKRGKWKKTDRKIVGETLRLWTLCQLLFPVGTFSQFSQKKIQKELSLRVPAVCSCGPVFLFAGRMFEEMGNVFQMAGHMARVQPWCENDLTPTHVHRHMPKTRLNMCAAYSACILQSVHCARAHPEWHYVLCKATCLHSCHVFQFISGPIR